MSNFSQDYPSPVNSGSKDFGTYSANAHKAYQNAMKAETPEKFGRLLVVFDLFAELEARETERRFDALAARLEALRRGDT
jgi:hypothetical protein